MPAGAKVGWSVMGTGTIGTEHMVAAIRAFGHSPQWVVSRSKRDAKQFAGDLAIPRATTDLDSVWSDPSVAFVYVSASVARRKHYILAAAEARKHILCDGPISLDSKGAQALVRHCDEAGVMLAVNQPFRASTIHQTMRRLISDGEIGTVQSVVIVRGGPYQPPPARRQQDKDHKGQIYLDSCIDDIDLARFLTSAEPVEALALAAPESWDPAQLAYAIRMGDGSIFQAYESFATTDLESIVLVGGDQGALIANGTLNGRASGTLVRRTGGRSELVPVRERELPLSTIGGFLSAFDEAAAPWLSTGADNHVALLGAEAVAMAARKGRAIVIEASS